MKINTKKEKILRRISFLCAVIYVVTLIISFYHNYSLQDYNALGMGVVAIFTPLIVPILFKLFHFKPVYEVYIISTIFIYFASLIGSTFHWYSLPGFDKVLHFSSGVFATIIAVIIFFYIRKTNDVSKKEDYRLFLMFINVTNIAIAAIWEYYEYAMLVFFNNDAINHFTSGVHDTMTDMLCATFAGLLLTICIHHYHKSGKANFFTNIYEKFYLLNISDTK